MMDDQQFREEHKPLHVPAHFDNNAPLREQLAFALADIGEGNADEVIAQLLNLHQKMDDQALTAEAKALLAQWDKNGLVTVNTDNGETRYNLHKITQANSGSVNPRLLAPGLD
ncbi:hypothetical protein LT679_07105 [Mucilaginibacter roseus]|uniref:DUF3375 domain-containing protein n=1 Tax=Mucilaginibacter roseus TaxID=1528868 RepID=A0ABS8TZR4_9SPHI|nr:hypothetical protein [Mucilaginibacter roseus]MCD8740368.1 hypothetical protein [Mucilaginibacter roseus]